MPLLFHPGNNISYSSAAFNVLADIVGVVSGRSLPVFLRERVFLPLGMSDTCLGISTDRQSSRETAMNREIATGMNGEQLHPNKDSLAIAREVANAAGGPSAASASAASAYTMYGHNCEYWRNLGAAWAGLTTTTADLSTLFQTLLGGGQRAGGGERILSAETVRQMCRCHTHGPDASLAGSLPPAIRSGECGSIWDDKPASHWGLSLRLNDGERKFGLHTPRTVFGHHGGAGAMVWADPASGVSFACLTTEPTMCYSSEFNELSDLAYQAALAF
jgi:CubicO group peptidase (beta-lactamase class C family)